MNKLTLPSILIVLFLSSSIHSQIVSTIWDSPTDKITDALILDENGNIYGADYNGQSVYILSPSGEVSTFVTGLNTPNGIELDSEGNLFVCDAIANRIYKIDSEGEFLDTVMTNNPSGILKALGSDTMIFTSYQANTINKLAPDGVVIETHEGGVLNGPVGLAFDEDGVLYVGNYTDREIYSVSGDDLNYLATVPGPTNGALGFIAYGGGLLWGTSLHGDEIYQIEPNYVDSTILYAGSVAGNMDGPIAEATFNNPNGIITNVAGDSIYISQFPGGEIRLISPSPLGGFEFEISAMSVYPNPTKENIQVSCDRPFDRVEVFDLLGNSVMNEVWSIKTSSWSLDIPDLNNGIYFLRLQDGARVVAEQKLVKY